MNGTVPGGRDDPVDLAGWQRLTEAVIGKREARIAEAEKMIGMAKKVIADSRAELKVLRRALAVAGPTAGAPAAPSPRQDRAEPSARDRAAAQLLEAARRAGPGVLSWGEARAVAGDRSGSTVSAALQLLVDRGDVVKDGPGKYRLASRA